MRVLVTGASGLLGAEVARLLVRQGLEVTTFQGRPSGVGGTTDFRGSVMNEKALRVSFDSDKGVDRGNGTVGITAKSGAFCNRLSFVLVEATASICSGMGAQ